MQRERFAAALYGFCAVVVIAFQMALAAGAPWGAYTMGGAVAGVLPTGLRLACAGQALFNGWMTLVVLVRAGVLGARWAPGASRLIWLVVVFGAIGTVLNLITPSAAERARWAPVAFLLFATSLIVARGPRTTSQRRPPFSPA